MNTFDYIRNTCLDYLIINRDRILISIEPLKTTRGSLLKNIDVAFVPYIEDEFGDLVRSMILVDLARHLPFNAEELITFLEGFNVVQYVDGML